MGLTVMSTIDDSNAKAAPDTLSNVSGGSYFKGIFGHNPATGIRLQFILFMCFLLISALPVVLLSAWDQHNALREEYEAVSEKHLIIAKNLSGVFGRYVKDVKEGFRFAVQYAESGVSNQASSRFLESLSFCDVSILDGANNVLQSLMAIEDGRPPLPTATVIARLREASIGSKGDVIISDIIRDRDQPRFFVVMALAGSRIAVGTLTTDYVRTVQRQIAFGERGHSMVVDAKGVVVAHPNKTWEETSKNAAKLSVVGAMMRGETGVSEFYSPPMKADMIAGHTAVPGVGWGVMVPQPVAELEHHANIVKRSGILITVIGIVFASIFSWWLSRFLSRPIVAIDDAAVAVTSGALQTQVAKLPKGSPRELHSLSLAFNTMVRQLREREERLHIAMNEAVAANQAKTEFLANMSHELRTPLNAVIGFSEMMKEETFGPIGAPKYVDYAAEIHNSGLHLMDVINDVLDMSKIEAGQLEPTFSEIDMSAIAETCISFTSERARKGHVILEANVRDGLPKMIADDRMMKQIILNLLSNAIKFTPQDGKVELFIDIDAQRRCVVKVRDNGIGIDPAKLSIVMRPFGQIDAELNRKYEGTGLGLPLVNSMVGMHGGTLEIDTALGQGTTVTITLPAERVVEDDDGSQSQSTA
ncbi:MAG: ATP-binding protein [Proteobacteria bacterium]|nr:ATP-binding protein [Pseudomonadota bacterium]